MSESAARALLRGAAGKLCVAYFEDEAGEIVFAEAPVVPLARLRRRPIVEAVKLVSAASVAALVGACTPHGDTAEVIHDDPPSAVEMLAPTALIPTRANAEPPSSSASVEPPAAEPCEPRVTRPRPRDTPIKGRLRPRKGDLVLDGDGSALGGL